MVVPHILVHDAQEGALVRHDNHDAVTHDDEREPLPRTNVRDGANGPTRSGGEEAPVARAQPAELLAAERRRSELHHYAHTHTWWCKIVNSVYLNVNDVTLTDTISSQSET